MERDHVFAELRQIPGVGVAEFDDDGAAVGLRRAWHFFSLIEDAGDVFGGDLTGRNMLTMRGTG